MRVIFFVLFFMVFGCKSINNRQVTRRTQRIDKNIDHGKWDIAISQLDILIKHIPDDANLYFKRGYAKEMALKYEECIDDFTKVIELNPNRPIARTNRGFAYRKLGEYEKAIKDFTEELSINPNPYSYEHRGFVKYLLKDNDSALIDISKSIELDPLNSIAYKSRSLVYFVMNKRTEACLDTKRAVELGIKIKYPEFTKEIEQIENSCNN